MYYLIRKRKRILTEQRKTLQAHAPAEEEQPTAPTEEAEEDVQPREHPELIDYADSLEDDRVLSQVSI